VKRGLQPDVDTWDDDLESREIAPGKVTRTLRLAPVQRRSSARRPGAGSDAPPASHAHPVRGATEMPGGTPSPASEPADDPFALHLLGASVQRDQDVAATAGVHAAAARGLTAPTESLPHLARIQRSFGPHHDVTGVRAHVGGPASEAAAAMGATAHATGDHVVFGSAPDLHTAAHEAAHTIQQRGGA